jgi:hypothetical protein
MKTIKITIMVLSLSVMYQFASAQNCPGNKVLMAKGWKGGCGCKCQKKCVDQSEVQTYINMGWYVGECFNVGRLCCNYIRNSKPGENIETMLADIHSDPASKAYTISFNLSKQSEVSLRVFDMTGRCVATVANKVFKENSHEVTWNVSGVNQGIYFLKMNTDGYNVTRKIAVTN